MATLWYNLPNYLSSILPHITPLATAAWEEIGFCACLTATAASTKTDNYLCTPPQSFFFFFLVSLPLFLSHSVVGRSPWIIHQCEMKKLMDIEYPLWSGGQPFFFFFSSPLSFFFVQLKRVKSGRSHCQGISKVNRLLYFVHIFIFFMVCDRRPGFGERWMRKRRGCDEKEWDKKIEQLSTFLWIVFCWKNSS